MSLDRLQSKTGLFQINPEVGSGGFPGGVSVGGEFSIVAGAAAATGGAIAPTPTPRSGTVPTLAGSGTVTHNGCGTCIVTTGGAVTGAIVQAGITHGQNLTIINNSANTITMAAAGTSNVANGTGCIISATAAIGLTWNAIDSRWYQYRAA